MSAGKVDVAAAAREAERATWFKAATRGVPAYTIARCMRSICRGYDLRGMKKFDLQDAFAKGYWSHLSRAQVVAALGGRARVQP